MKFKITLLCVFLSLIITSTACSQKVYFWKDERGITNATTTPPPDNIKEYQTDSFASGGRIERKKSRGKLQRMRETGEPTKLNLMQGKDCNSLENRGLIYRKRA
jgi:hypothetical protein